MWSLISVSISVSLAIIVNSFSPEIPESLKEDENPELLLETDFQLENDPFLYFRLDKLTEKQAWHRVRIIIFRTFSFVSGGATTIPFSQLGSPILPPAIERVI